MKFWTRPEAVNQTAFAVDLSSRVLTHFEEYFNIPYPLAKMGKYSQAIKLCWLDVMSVDSKLYACISFKYSHNKL